MNTKIFFRLVAFVATLCLIWFLPWSFIEPDWLKRVFYYSAEFIAFTTGSELIKHIFFHYYRKRKRIKTSKSDNFIEAINNLHYILIFFAVLVTFLSFFNLNLLDVITSLSIVAAAIAIISKDYLSNIISGMITVFTKEIEIGDNIQILHHKGKVKSLTLSKMVLLNDDDDVVFLPNSVVFSSDFINYSKRTVKKTSIDFEMKNENLKSVSSLENFLRDGIKDYMEFIDVDSLYLRIEEIKHDSVVFKFQYNLKSANRELEREVRRRVKREILNYFC